MRAITVSTLTPDSLGRVRSAPPDSGFAPGDLVVGVVRRVPLDDYRAAFEPRPDDIKTVVALR